MRVGGLLTICILALASFSFGQVAYSDWDGKHAFRINANGSLGLDLNTLRPASFYENNTNLPLLKQAGLWIIAQDKGGAYHTATHFQNEVDGYDFWAGPVDTLTGQTSGTSEWNKVWTVTKDEIDYHKENSQKVGYEVPLSLRSWPAKGSDGFANYLAPFIDVNDDGEYKPEQGDYPDIKGIKSAYCIFNDLEGEHKASLGQEIGIEVTMLVSQLEVNSSASFLEYFIINRRPTDYENIKVGFFIDGQCGNRFDNYAGTFSNYPESIFVYQGDETDEGFFNNDLPYIYATFQNENLHNSIAFNDSKDKNGKPLLTEDFINYSNSIWKDSSFLTVGNDGTSGNIRTDFIYNQSNLNPWAEEDAPNMVGARTIAGFVEHTDFSRDDFIRFNVLLDIGIVNNENIIDDIFKKSLYADKLFRETSSIKDVLSTIELFPNPAKSIFTIKSNRLINSIQIRNNLGKLVYSKNKINSASVLCNNTLTKGVYYITINTKGGSFLEKLILTK